MSSYYKQVCSSCSATESDNWKKIEELGTWVCWNCFDDIIAENVSSDEEVTREITTRRFLRVTRTRSARVCPQQPSTPTLTERGRRWIFKRRIPVRGLRAAKKTIFTPFTSDELQYNGVLYKGGDVVKVHGGCGFYYAQLRRFLTLNGEKSASVLWLKPKHAADCNAEKDFNPSDYTAGMEDDMPYKLEAMTFILRLPMDFFKTYSMTPYSRHVPREAQVKEAVEFLSKYY